MTAGTVVVGSGNAALYAAIAARQARASVRVLEKAKADEAGGNAWYTAAALRVAHSGGCAWPTLARTVVEIVDGLFYGSYLGGSGPTAGAVIGRRTGPTAALCLAAGVGATDPMTMEVPPQ